MRRAALLSICVLAAAGCGGEDDEAPAPRAQATPAATAGEHPGLKVWVAQGCGSCHTLEAAGSTGPVGPDLDAALKGRDRGYIAGKIVAPPAGSMMPEDFATRMSDKELDDLVDFVAEATR